MKAVSFKPNAHCPIIDITQKMTQARSATDCKQSRQNARSLFIVGYRHPSRNRNSRTNNNRCCIRDTRQSRAVSFKIRKIHKHKRANMARSHGYQVGIEAKIEYHPILEILGTKYESWKRTAINWLQQKLT